MGINGYDIKIQCNVFLDALTNGIFNAYVHEV